MPKHNLTLYCGYQRREYERDPEFVWLVALQLQVQHSPASELLQLALHGRGDAPIISLRNAGTGELLLVDAASQPLVARPMTIVLQALLQDTVNKHLLFPDGNSARLYQRVYDALEPLAAQLEGVLFLEEPVTEQEGVDYA